MVDAVKMLGALLGGGNMSSGTGSGILKSVLGAAMRGGNGGSRGGLDDLLGSVMQGAGSQGSGDRGLGGMLGGLLGGGSSGGGLGDMLGGRSQAAPSSGAAGGLGDLLGGILGGQPQGASGIRGANLPDLIGAALSQFGHAEKAAQKNQEPAPFDSHSPDLDISQVQDQATIMIRAMINAAKADGRVDKAEQDKILGRLGSVTRDEIDFINTEISHPLDVEDFARSVPRGMEGQVYAMSLMAIDLDSQAEAKYLHQLGQSMGMQPEVINQVHRQLGVQALYA